jgi:hypothetical protein
MDNIKIIRLQNGDDIIGSVVFDYDEYYIKEPMLVGLEYVGNKAGLMMRQWLPTQLIKKNEIRLKERDILFVVEPADDFCEYYTHTVEKLTELLDYKEKTKHMDEQQINNIMDAYEEMNHGTIVH